MAEDDEVFYTLADVGLLVGHAWASFLGTPEEVSWAAVSDELPDRVIGMFDAVLLEQEDGDEGFAAARDLFWPAFLEGVRALYVELAAERARWN